MNEITNYSKGKEPLEDRITYVCNLIDKLYKDSFTLFSEILDLGEESYYKVNNLIERTIELNKLYKDTKEAYNYLAEIELSSYNYAFRRFQLKLMVTMLVTIYSFLSNALLGIFAFVVLNKKASKELVKEVAKLEKSDGKFDDDKVDITERTLDNCNRILNGKLKRMEETYKGYSVTKDYVVVTSNYYLSLFLDDKIGIDKIDALTSSQKEEIKIILKHDLKTDIDDIYSLLNIAKKKNNDGIKLIKEYKKS